MRTETKSTCVKKQFKKKNIKIQKRSLFLSLFLGNKKMKNGQNQLLKTTSDSKKQKPDRKFSESVLKKKKKKLKNK